MRSVAVVVLGLLSGAKAQDPRFGLAFEGFQGSSVVDPRIGVVGFFDPRLGVAVPRLADPRIGVVDPRIGVVEPALEENTPDSRQIASVANVPAPGGLFGVAAPPPPPGAAFGVTAPPAPAEIAQYLAPRVNVNAPDYATVPNHPAVCQLVEFLGFAEGTPHHLQVVQLVQQYIQTVQTSEVTAPAAHIVGAPHHGAAGGHFGGRHGFGVAAPAPHPIISAIVQFLGVPQTHVQHPEVARQLVQIIARAKAYWRCARTCATHCAAHFPELDRHRELAVAKLLVRLAVHQHHPLYRQVAARCKQSFTRCAQVARRVAPAVVHGLGTVSSNGFVPVAVGPLGYSGFGQAGQVGPIGVAV